MRQLGGLESGGWARCHADVARARSCRRWIEVAQRCPGGAQKRSPEYLLELVGDPADVCHVVLGVGINVNMQAADEVDQQWTSIRLEIGQKLFDRNNWSLS